MSAPADVGVLVSGSLAIALESELSAGSIGVVICDSLAELKLAGPSVVLLDAALVSSAELIAECEARTALVLVADDKADEVLASLPAKTEILASRSPVSLVARRIARVVGARQVELDPLTEVMTRSSFWQALLSREGTGGPHSLVCFDIDHFKRINDRHGHLAGDAVLRAAAARLLASCPAGSIVARIGGEEFAVYAALDATAARALAESVLAAFRAAPCADIAVELSAGTATATATVSADALMKDADEALYAAKAAGRDRVVSYSELTEAALAGDRDVSLEAFETRTRVIAERVAEAITARGRQLFDKLQKRADVDVVTGLYSRGYFDRRFSFELEQAQRNETPVTVALVDLDHFGEVNKTFGWPTGDEALRVVSEAIAKNVRSTDWVARYGGEELCVVMIGTDLELGRVVLDRLVRVVAGLTLAATDGREFNLTVSIGAATATELESAATLLDRASKCLLDAKRAGRNRLAVGGP